MKAIITSLALLIGVNAHAGVYCQEEAKALVQNQLYANEIVGDPNPWPKSNLVRITDARLIGTYNGGTTEEWDVTAEVFNRSSEGGEPLKTSKQVLLKATQGCREIK